MAEWQVFQVILLTTASGGEPAQIEAFNYFFSLMLNFMVVLFIPYVCLKLVWSAGKD